MSQGMTASGLLLAHLMNAACGAAVVNVTELKMETAIWWNEYHTFSFNDVNAGETPNSQTYRIEHTINLGWVEK